MKVQHGKLRAEYVRRPETNRDPLTPAELKPTGHRAGAKLYRKAREGKL